MKNSEILKSDLLDILFEHRNKSYGAYALRRQYNSRLIRALITTFLAVGLLFFLTSYKEKKSERKKPARDEVIIKTFVLEPEKPKEEEIIKPKPRPASQVNQVKWVDNIKIVPDDTKVDMPDLDDLDKAIISDKTVLGDLPEDPNQKILNAVPGDGTGKTETPKQPVELGPSFAPSFPGGTEGLVNFLRRNLREPNDLEPGMKITVLVRFMVDRNGRISEAKVVQSGGDEYDREVLRVIKKMPAWEPGLQNGHPISMYFTQPITFIGQEM